MQSCDAMAHEAARGVCYRLLAACFYQPDQALLLEEDVPAHLSAALEQACPEAVASARAMGTALAESSPEELAVAYARLFVGPQRLVAPPYGSVYLDEGGRVMGDSTLAVLRTYQEAGLALDPDLKQPPDHIALELEFLSYLTDAAVAAWQASDVDRATQAFEARERFRERYLTTWVSPFCARITEGTESDFYRALADCLSTVVTRGPSARTLPALDGRRGG